jgi:hypothetical protein
MNKGGEASYMWRTTYEETGGTFASPHEDKDLVELA